MKKSTHFEIILDTFKAGLLKVVHIDLLGVFKILVE